MWHLGLNKVDQVLQRLKMIKIQMIKTFLESSGRTEEKLGSQKLGYIRCTRIHRGFYE